MCLGVVKLADAKSKRVSCDNRLSKGTRMINNALMKSTLAMIGLITTLPLHAATPACEGKVYGKGKKAICLPLGELSFADKLVSFTPGPKNSEPPFDQGENSLGEPNYKNTRSPDFISLGCHGELVVQFVDNVLIDVAGMDLYIFEVGPFVEKTQLYISNDGSDWIAIGEIEGSRADIDIGPFVKPEEKFSYVKLVNAGKSCGGKHSGADIDAIAAVGAEIRLSLDSALLFDTGQSALKPEALTALDALATKITGYGKNTKVTIEGHTDSTGNDSDNQKLSETRASAVSTYLVSKVKTLAGRVKTKGYGELRPVDNNDTEAGRMLNRRVDVLVVPGK